MGHTKRGHTFPDLFPICTDGRTTSKATNNQLQIYSCSVELQLFDIIQQAAAAVNRINTFLYLAKPVVSSLLCLVAQ